MDVRTGLLFLTRDLSSDSTLENAAYVPSQLVSSPLCFLLGGGLVRRIPCEASLSHRVSLTARQCATCDTMDASR